MLNTKNASGSIITGSRDLRDPSPIEIPNQAPNSISPERHGQFGRKQLMTGSSVLNKYIDFYSTTIKENSRHQKQLQCQTTLKRKKVQPNQSDSAGGRAGAFSHRRSVSNAYHESSALPPPTLSSGTLAGTHSQHTYSSHAHGLEESKKSSRTMLTGREPSHASLKKQEESPDRNYADGPGPYMNVKPRVITKSQHFTVVRGGSIGLSESGSNRNFFVINNRNRGEQS